MSVLDRTIERLARRILLAIGRGRITAANDGGPVQVLQVRLGANELIDALPRLAEYGLTSLPPAGSDVVALFIAGARDNGVVIATGNQADRPKGLQPGETMVYDHLGKQVYLSANGIVIEAKGQPVTIKDASTIATYSTGGFTINDNLIVNGEITATGEGTFAGGHTVSQHTHTQPADAHGDAEQPTNKPQG